MAQKLHTYYPDRFDAPSSEYPQGKWRNRSSSTAHDAGYLDQGWLNDQYGFLGKLLREGGITPDGTIDTALKSQYFDALVNVINERVKNKRDIDDNKFKGILELECLGQGEESGLVFTDGEGGVNGNLICNQDGVQVNNVTDGETDGSYIFPKREGIYHVAVIEDMSGDIVELHKNDLYTPAFSKVSASSIKVKPDTHVRVEGVVVNISDKVIELTDKLAGNDYVVTVDKSGNLNTYLDKFETPATIPNGNYIIGGFHYSLIPEDETLATGGFATSGNGMVWTQDDVNRIRGINEFSLWDIRFRAGGRIASPLSSRFGQLSNHGMTYDFATNRWYAIYHASTDVDKFGISRAGTDIASGTVLAKVPSAYSGNGTKKYDNLNWWTANELANSQGSRLMYEFEFNNRAFGTTENKTAGGAEVTYPKTERIKGLTSRIGCEQVTGVQYYWGLESSYRSDAGSWEWRDVTGGRGNYYIQGPYSVVKSLFGGTRAFAPARVGSRCVSWSDYPWVSSWLFGAVATRDHLVL